MKAASLSASQTHVSSRQAGVVVGVGHCTPWFGKWDAQRRPAHPRGGGDGRGPGEFHRARRHGAAEPCEEDQKLVHLGDLSDEPRSPHIVYAADAEGRLVNRPWSARARRSTCPPGGVLLNALCKMFMTADIRSCESASTPTRGR